MAGPLLRRHELGAACEANRFRKFEIPWCAAGAVIRHETSCDSVRVTQHCSGPMRTLLTDFYGEIYKVVINFAIINRFNI